jgi:FtrD-like iron-sulfur protein
LRVEKSFSHLSSVLSHRSSFFVSRSIYKENYSMAFTYKLIPNLLAWAGIVLVLLRGFPGRRPVVPATSMTGFVLGLSGACLLFDSFPGNLPFGIIKSALGVSFLLLWGVSVVAINWSTGQDMPMRWGERLANSRLSAGTCSLMAGMLMGAVCASKVAGTGDIALVLVCIALAAAALAAAAPAVEKRIPDVFTVTLPGLTAAVVALLLFSSSSILRLDLFSPLSMKVMKFIHDFVHQFFESMLIPDHLFIRTNIWGYIGFLFSNGVGFWGALILWFIPAILIFLAIYYGRMPSVAHIRQGAQRRKLLAAAVRARHFKLVVPVISIMILAASVYQSRFPNVEYWDPKPVLVTATPSGDIIIPKKGEVDLEDGKLHKYLFKQGGKEARFLILKFPSGEWTVDLDACAICKPDGYGQAEGMVYCYYCKTLIPLETVGKPGGCNPVPIPFSVKDDGIHIDSLTLINSWGTTVQSTTRIKEGGK